FCDETEEDHRQTLSLMQEVGYDSAFMFYYSQRPNTLAARKFPDNVPLETKTRRLNEIIELQNKLSLESNKKDIGSIFDVLVEGVSKRSDKQMMGRNKKNKMCIFDAEGVKPGDIVSVKITECTSATLKGVIVPPKKPLIDKDSLADWKEMKERFRLRREEFENELKKSLEEIEQKREAHRKNRKSTDEEK
ncbi:MAG: TRAM domain-containing protein, partial [Candidatus Egerieousia sp.]